MNRWSLLGEGNNNTTYRSSDAKWVLKLQKDRDQADTPERSVRLWQEIKHTQVDSAYIISLMDNKQGWICPYIEGRPPSDSRIMNALIDIYNRTGRIVVDATVSGNFIDALGGYTVCVDVGMALQLDRRETVFFDGIRVRRPSIISRKTWDDTKQQFLAFFTAYEPIYPRSIHIIKSLLFIKKNRPDIYNGDFLNNRPDLIRRLVSAYDNQGVEAALVCLDMIPDVISQKAIRDCINELEQYIQSRGSFDYETRKIEHSTTTRFFRDTTLTTKKIKLAVYLITQLARTRSLERAQAILNGFEATSEAKKGLSQGLLKSIKRCEERLLESQQCIRQCACNII